MAFPVKIYRSTDTGAPTLSGTAGALLGVIDACLITGYNPVTVDSLTWQSGVATARCNNPHGYVVGDVLRIEGAGTAAFNGEHRVTGITSATYTYDVPGTGYPSTITGTVTARKAAAGWKKTWTGTNVSAYQSQDVSSAQHLLRVNDSGTRFAWVRGYETMTDIDTGTGLFPTLVQMAATNYLWTKSDAANATAKEWMLVADSRLFYLVMRPWALQGCTIVWFGDPQTFNASDQYATMMQGQSSANPTFAGDAGRLYVNGDMTGRYMARGYHGVGSAVQFGLYGKGMQTYSGYANGWPFPNPAGAGMVVNPLIIGEASLTAARGILPGIYQILHNQPLSHGDQLPIRAQDGSIRNGVLVDFATDNASVRGRTVIDLDGPWR